MHSAFGDMESSEWRPGLDAAFENGKRHDPADDTSLMGFYFGEIGQGLLLPVCGQADGTEAPSDAADILCDFEADQHWSANDYGNAGEYSSSGERSLCENLVWEADTVGKMLSSNSPEDDFVEMDFPRGDESSDAVTGWIPHENVSTQRILLATADNMSYSARCIGQTAHNLTEKIDNSWLTAKQTELPVLCVGQTILSKSMEGHEEFSVAECQNDSIKWSDSKASHETSNMEKMDDLAVKAVTDDDDDDDDDGNGGGAAGSKVKMRNQSRLELDLDLGKGATKKTRFWGIGCRESLSIHSSDEINESKLGVDVSMMSDHSQRGAASAAGPSPPTSKNLVSERMRRQKLNDKLYSLRALVPNISKMNKASIVGDAIEYVKDLKKQIEDTELEISQLEACKEELKNDIPCALPLCKGKHQTMNWSCKKRTKLVHEILELDVNSMEGRLFQFRIHCKKSPGVVLQLARALEMLDIHIINGNMTSINDRILSTLVIEVNGAHIMKSQDLRKQALEAIQKSGLLLAKST